MVLANPFTHDTRVHKQARSLIEWGCNVHVIAIARPGLPVRETVDEIEVHRVGVSYGAIARLLPVALLWPFGRLALRLAVPVMHTVPPLPEPAAATAVREDVASATTDPDAAPTRWQRWRREAGRRANAGQAPWPLIRAVGLPAYRLARRVPRRLLNVSWRRPRAFARRAGRAAVTRFLHPMFRLLAFDVTAARRVRALAPDVVECHDLNTLLAGVLIKRMHGTPIVYDSHELFLERNIGDVNRERDRRHWGPVERFGIRRCDRVFSVAAGICDHLQRQYALDCAPILIRNVQPYEPPPPRETILAEEFGLDPQRPIVLYPGAITFNRGLEQLVEAAALTDEIAYVVMGPSSNPAYRAELEAAAEANGTRGRTIFFRDPVPIDAVGRYTASADLGIVPTQNACLSYFYESSNKIFHCLMAGVPLVMSDHAEKRLIVEHWSVGALFDETDPADIHAVVTATLRDRAGLATMQHRALHAARVLNWEHEEEKLRTAFAELIDSVRPGAAPPVPVARVADAPIVEVSAPTDPTPSVRPLTHGGQGTA